MPQTPCYQGREKGGSFASADTSLKDHTARRAEMRIVYEVVGGSLPFGFMCELQVLMASLAQAEPGYPDREIHFASEAAVVDRMVGSVLSAAYKCGGGVSREWVILSVARTGDSQASGAMAGPATDCIRLMGWVELSSEEGATDWRLLTRVMRLIEDLASGWGHARDRGHALGLCLRKMAYYVDAGGTPAIGPREISHKRRAEVLNFALVGGGQEDVDSECVLPSGSELVLFKPQQACVSDSTLNRVGRLFRETN